MQTVAITQDASFSLNYANFGKIQVNYENFGNKPAVLSNITQKKDGKPSFDEMIQKASYEKNEKKLQEEKPIAENTSEPKEKNLAKKSDESPGEIKEPIDNSDEKVALNSGESDLKNQKNVSNQKIDEKSDLALKKDEKTLDSHQTAKSQSKNSTTLQKNIAEHSIQETMRLSDSAKVEKKSEPKKPETEKKTEIASKILKDDYDLSILEKINLLKDIDEEKLADLEDFTNLESLLASQNLVNLEQNAVFTQNFSENDLLGDDLQLADLEKTDGKKSNNFFLDKDKKILVSDYRSQAETEKVDPTESKKSALKFSDVTVTSDNSAEMTVELMANENTNANVLSMNNQSAGANGSNFQAMLTNQIQQNASEFVRAGNIVLKDNDSGQIKLILHPESLGNVKIDLHIEDKSITGRIVVASAQAYNAFKESADSLREAFIQSGFDAAGFELSYSGQNDGQNQNGQQHDNGAQLAVSRTYGEYSSAVVSDSDDIENFSEFSLKNAINIVA